jgi:fumarate hydratase, class I
MTANPLPAEPSAVRSAAFDSMLELIRRTSTILPDDVARAIGTSRKNEEPGSNADVALDVIGCNILLAKDNSLPLCQDTGTILFYVHAPVGYDQIELEETATEAVREATRLGYLRQNSVDSISGKNSGDNTGPGSPVFHFHQWRRPHVEVKLMLKGGGCENMNAQYSLPHPDLGGRDLNGVENAILDAVVQAQGQGCGPGILGVCIGGDRGTGYMHAKEQLLRELDAPNGDPVLDQLERTIVEKANRSGIGPMGFGGRTTLLACKIGAINRLPASYFVSVAYMCWAYRRRGMVMDASGNVQEWLY